MYLKIKKEKIEIVELSTFWERFKSLKFMLEKLDYGILLNKRSFLSTYFFCQKIDAIFTDDKNEIIYVKKNLKSEKFMFPKFKVRKVYLFPLGTIDKLGEIRELEIIGDEK